MPNLRFAVPHKNDFSFDKTEIDSLLQETNSRIKEISASYEEVKTTMEKIYEALDNFMFYGRDRPNYMVMGRKAYEHLCLDAGMMITEWSSTEIIYSPALNERTFFLCGKNVKALGDDVSEGSIYQTYFID